VVGRVVGGKTPVIANSLQLAPVRMDTPIRACAVNQMPLSMWRPCRSQDKLELRSAGPGGSSACNRWLGSTTKI
jgi:hypothetical protein